MHLYQLSVQNFKNYSSEQISFPGKITSLVGNNGAGKTNILDAIHYLSFCKSYFNTVDAFNITHGEDQFSVLGRYKGEDEGSSDTVQCVVRRNQRKIFKYNGKEIDRFSDHIGRIPAVMVSPYDTALIDGGSEERRKYIDVVISQYDKVYLDDLIAFNRALAQRNMLLKQMAGEIRYDPLLLEPWNELLIRYGTEIHRKRQIFVSDFTPVFNSLYQHMAGTHETSGISYTSQLEEEAGYRTLLLNSLEKDRYLRYTSSGIHKDDLILTLGGMAVKRFGSQGQQKTFILALKLAQFRFLHQTMRIKPILLLDDVFDKLDRERIERLMDLVSSNDFGQIFITDTNAARIELIFSSIRANTDILQVNNGKIHPA